MMSRTTIFFVVLLAVVATFFFAALATAADPEVALDIPEVDASLLGTLSPEEARWATTDESHTVAALKDENIYDVINGLLRESEAKTKNPAEQQKKGGDNTKNNNNIVIPESYVGAPTPSMFTLLFAPWCQHCKAIKPVFRNASAAVAFTSVAPNKQMFPGAADGRPPKPWTRRGARFSTCDATVEKRTARTFHVKSYPMFAFFLPILAWNGDGTPGRRMAGFPYQGGRDSPSFEFAARYLDLGLRRGFVTPTQGIEEVMQLRNVEPPRVLFLVGPAANATDLWRQAAPPGFVAAALTSGKAHFGTYAALEEKDQKNKQSTQLKSAPHKRLHDNLVAAFKKASRGPGGEYMICVTELEQELGAVPYTGEWPEAVPVIDPKAVVADAKKKLKEEKAAAADSSEAATAEDDEASDDPETTQKQITNVAIHSLAPATVADAPAVAWINRMSLLAVEQVSGPVFQQLSQEGRYIALAITRGSMPGRALAEVNRERDRATWTLTRYLQARRSQLKKELAAEEKDAVSEKESEIKSEDGSSSSSGDSSSSSSNKNEKNVKAALDILKTSTAVPVGHKTSSSVDKLYLAVLDGAIFADFVGDLGIKAVPSFVVFDTKESSVFQDPEDLHNHVNLDEAWNYDNNGGDNEQSDALVKQAVDAVTMFLQRIDDGGVVDVPISTIGRVARVMTTYIPGLQRAKEYFQWDATALIAIVGGGFFSILVFVLASGGQQQSAEEEAAMRRQWKAEQVEILKRQKAREQQEKQKQPVRSSRGAAAAAAAAAAAKKPDISLPESSSGEEGIDE